MSRRQRMEDWYNVVVNFLSLVIFVFLLFLGMLMYANEVDTKEKEKLLKIKINYNLYNTRLRLLEVENYWWIDGCLFQKRDPQRLHLLQYLVSFFPSFFFH